MLTLLLLVVIEFSSAEYRSCAEIYMDNYRSDNNTYQILNRQNQTYNVYCEFHHNYGYTYIMNSSAVDITIEDLYTTNQHVRIRHITADGLQKYSRMEQISQSSIHEGLGIFFNETTGYTNPKNYLLMAPYLFIGFQQRSLVSKGSINGYRCNGVDQSFKNCDSNPNSYFTLYFNKANADPIKYNHDNAFIRRWIQHAYLIPPSECLPPEFFFFYEMHMGGCGGYTDSTIPPEISVALGLRFDITMTTTEKATSTATSLATKECESSELTCGCINATQVDVNLTMDELSERISMLRKQLIVEKEALSSFRNKKYSAPDSRMSSTAIGYVGAALLGLTFSLIVMMDLPYLVAAMKLNCRRYGTQGKNKG